jgi:hypothetical protein
LVNNGEKNHIPELEIVNEMRFEIKSDFPEWNKEAIKGESRNDK